MEARVDNLKNAIKMTTGQDFDGLSPGRLNLYKILANEETDIYDLLRTPEPGRLLQGSEFVRDVFNDVPLLQRPRVVVEPPGESKQICDSVDLYLPRPRMLYRSEKPCNCPFYRAPAIEVYPGTGSEPVNGPFSARRGLKFQDIPVDGLQDRVDPTPWRFQHPSHATPSHFRPVRRRLRYT